MIFNIFGEQVIKGLTALKPRALCSSILNDTISNEEKGELHLFPLQPEPLSPKINTIDCFQTSSLLERVLILVNQ